MTPVHCHIYKQVTHGNLLYCCNIPAQLSHVVIDSSVSQNIYNKGSRINYNITAVKS